ncbi:hypothetical protein YC2023_123303 [Brassica napus]
MIILLHETVSVHFKLLLLFLRSLNNIFFMACVWGKRNYNRKLKFSFLLITTTVVTNESTYGSLCFGLLVLTSNKSPANAPIFNRSTSRTNLLKPLETATARIHKLPQPQPLRLNHASIAYEKVGEATETRPGSRNGCALTLCICTKGTPTKPALTETSIVYVAELLTLMASLVDYNSSIMGLKRDNLTHH